MTSSRALVVALALALAASSSSCRLFRKSAKAAPAPPPPPAASKTSTGPPKPAEAPPPPELPPGKPSLEQQLPVPAPRLPAPPQKRGSRRLPAKPAPAPPPAPPPEPAPEPAPPPVPELGQILTPQQQQEYNQAIDRSIYRAQRNLAAWGGRRLNPEQTLAVERIKTFIQQALEARKTDLLRAKSLAERADVLAEDLLRSLQ
jgi:hypothetical protein